MSFKQFKSQFKKYGLRLALRYAYNRKRSWWMLKHDMVEGHYHRELHKLTRDFMNENSQLRKENKKLRIERDAAVEDLKTVCQHYNISNICDMCSGKYCRINALDSGGCEWEWRGVQE